MVNLDALGVNIHGIYTNQLVWVFLPSTAYVFQLICDLDEAKIQLECSQQVGPVFDNYLWVLDDYI
jgi:hypothetical protein